MKAPRTTMGPSDRVVIVGAGLAGLSTAMRLAATGRQVTVLERGATAGGRAAVLTSTVEGGTYRFDPGPTVLTMPELIEDCFDALGERMSDRLELLPVDPLYRARYADGSTLDVHADPKAMETAIEELAGPDEAAGFRRYKDFVSDLYRYEIRDFIDRNTDSPLDMLTPNLARIVALGGLRRLAPKVGSYLKDPRVQRVFSFQALYAGLAPQQALAIYAVISYMDAVAGVHFPRGGMHAVPEAMAAAAADHGVDFRYGTEVTGVERRGDRAVAVTTAAGERFACDALVLTPDLPVAQRDLLGVEPRKLRYSPSAVVLLAGSRTRYPTGAHHTIHFGEAWDEVFTDLAAGRVMRDPSILVSHPTLTDPSLAPGGRDFYYVLAPAPNLDGDIDWVKNRGPYREELIGHLERLGYAGFEHGLEVEHLITPADWADMGMERGTPFAASHTFLQTGPFRPGNLWGENVVFAGSGTRPGVGVPMVLISGRLAAERIAGPDPGYRSRAWR